MSMLDYYGEFAKIAPLLSTLELLRKHGIDRDVCLILPASVLPGVTSAYGLKIHRADVPEPMIGIPGGQ